jgi:hypothetical protein
METEKDRWPVARIARERGKLQLDPIYQREGGVWSTERKQLFIDSILNGYDVPKVYLHDLGELDSGVRYAVVDGKQRLTTIHAFIDGQFPLDEGFKYQGVSLISPPNPGQYYKDFSDETKEVFREKSLDIVIVKTSDTEDIEELFSRLNNGEKLNAAEQRNAFGGKMASQIRELATSDFFTRKLGFSNRRFSHLEVSAKILYIEDCEIKQGKGNGFVDVKKRHLDKFVKDNKTISDSDLKKLVSAVEKHLNWMQPVFEDSDSQLGKQSFPQLMYLFTKKVNREYADSQLQLKIKDFLAAFTEERVENQRKTEDERDPELTEYGRLTQQGTNDGDSMRRRSSILVRRFLKFHPEISLRDAKRLFDEDERTVIWQRAGKKCQKCGNALSLEEMQADHILMHSHGGQTTLDNARALCVPCNASKKHN